MPSLYRMKVELGKMLLTSRRGMAMISSSGSVRRVMRIDVIEIRLSLQRVPINRLLFEGVPNTTI
jgi:hypothetical protein